MSTTTATPTKLSIFTVEGPTITVQAIFNPKELQVDKAVPWTKSKSSKGNVPDLEFSSADGRSMSFELMFDTYEDGSNVHTTCVAPLILMSMVQNLEGSEDKKRPPKVKVQWGNGLPDFIGVLESVSTKYTMFLPNGTPVRATCNVKLKEADKLSFKKSQS